METEDLRVIEDYHFSVNEDKINDSIRFERQLKIVIDRIRLRKNHHWSNVQITLDYNGDDFINNKKTLRLRFSPPIQ